VSGKKPDPTPEEIKAECEKIQQEWTENQKRSRTVKGPDRWELPEYNVMEIMPAMGKLVDSLDKTDRMKED
jgi:hypothetical protein